MSIIRLIAAAGVSAIAMLVASPVNAGAQSGQLSGVVLTAPDETPLSEAEVLFEALKLHTRSDSLGRYTISGLPRGKYEVTVRHVGFKPFIASLVIGGGGKMDADFILEAASTTLATFDVRAEIRKRWAPQLVEFESRRKMGFGKFVTPDVVDRYSHLSMETLLRNVLGSVTVQDIRGSKVAVSKRGVGACPVQVLLDRLVMYNGEDVYFDLSLMNPERIIGIEYYPRLMTPFEFLSRPRGGTGGSGCGTLIIWLKH